MSSNFKSAVAQVKEAYSIEDYIANDGVVLKQNGASKLKGLCPMPNHNEKTPSFSVDTQFQNYYCFGCKESGDIIEYVQVTQNLSFWEALELLASGQGIELKSKSDEPYVDYGSLRAIVKDTALFYVAHFKKLSEDHPAKRQIIERGLSLDTMRFGYAPEKRRSLYDFLSKRGYSDDLIHQSGVCRKSQSDSFYDFWNGRLMFTIADIQGNPIGFSGRKLFDSDDRGKYVNSTDTPLFNKSKALFNVSQAKKEAGKQKEIFVVEGQFDVAAFIEAGFSNVLASSGTSFTESHAATCSRLVSGENGRVVFAFDGDQAGVKAAERVFQTCPNLHTLAFAVPFTNGDPCDMRQEKGNEEFQEFISSAQVPLVDFVLQNLEDRSDLSSMTGRAKYVKSAAELLASVKSRPILDSAIRRVALHSVSAHASVVEEVVKARKKVVTKPKSTSVDEGEPLPPSPDEYEDDPEFVESDEVNNEEDILEKISNDQHYSLAARFVAITVRFPKLRKSLVNAKDLLPEGLQTFSVDMKSILDEDEKKRILPEHFTDVKVAKKLLSQDFMPHLNSMSSEEIVSLYKRLGRKLKDQSIKQDEESLHGRIAQTLGAGNNATVEDLKRALALEQKLKAEVG